MSSKDKLIEEFTFLGSCSRCGLSLQKAKSFRFVPVNKKAKWDFPAVSDTLFNLPWKLATGVLCESCAKANLQPFWAVELRGDTVYNYTMVELEDSISPDKELVEYVKKKGTSFPLSDAPSQVREAVRKYLNGEEMQEKEFSLIRWYVWQKVDSKKSKLHPNARDKISFLDQSSFRRYVEEEIKGKAGIDPFSST